MCYWDRDDHKSKDTFLDEPTSGLDSFTAGINKIVRLLKTSKRKVKW